MSQQFPDIPEQPTPGAHFLSAPSNHLSELSGDSRSTKETDSATFPEGPHPLRPGCSMAGIYRQAPLSEPTG